MFGWSTGVLFAIVNRLQYHFFKAPANFSARPRPVSRRSPERGR